MAKILIVDDEINLVELVHMQLEEHGYEVIAANDGEEGLEKAKSENPDIIVLDIIMPKIGGFEVCRILKNNARYSKIPIIFLTAMAQQLLTYHKCSCTHSSRSVKIFQSSLNPSVVPLVIPLAAPLIVLHPCKNTINPKMTIMNVLKYINAPYYYFTI